MIKKTLNGLKKKGTLDNLYCNYCCAVFPEDCTSSSPLFRHYQGRDGRKPNTWRDAVLRSSGSPRRSGAIAAATAATDYRSFLVCYAHE